MKFTLSVSIFTTLLGLPADVRYDFANWNVMTHGNITVVALLFISRYSYFQNIHPLVLMASLEGCPGSQELVESAITLGNPTSKLRRPLSFTN